MHMEGYPRVKVNPMGANFALLEALDEHEIPALINDVKDWISN